MMIFLNRHRCTVAQSCSYWTEVPDVPKAPLAVMNMGGLEVEGPGAEAAWDSLFPVGGGYLYIGDDHRRYGISMFHQVFHTRLNTCLILNVRSSSYTASMLSEKP